MYNVIIDHSSQIKKKNIQYDTGFRQGEQSEINVSNYTALFKKILFTKKKQCQKCIPYVYLYSLLVSTHGVIVEFQKLSNKIYNILILYSLSRIEGCI